jgi:hypothetical protein
VTDVSSAEILRDDMRAGNAELTEQRRQVLGVAVHRVPEVLRFVGMAVAGHVRRDCAAGLARAGEEFAPVIGRPGTAVDEDDRDLKRRNAHLKPPASASSTSVGPAVAAQCRTS